MSLKTICDDVQEKILKYPYQMDLTLWGSPDFWERISVVGRGDCEDYALEARFLLTDSGIPLASIRLAECITETGGYHAILFCSDAEAGGDWIIDQRQPHVCTLSDLRRLGYHGSRMQVPGEYRWEEYKIQPEDKPQW